MIVETFAQFSKMLLNLASILDKAEKFAVDRKFDVANMLNARLAPDQFNFIRQIQITSDTVKFGATRLTGLDAPKFEDNEATLSDLRGRIQKTVDFLATIKPENFDGWTARKTLNPRREGKYLPGDEYLVQHVIPNFYFHVTTAYAILRHNGVEIGKMDYLGAINYRDL
ncbi:MAG: hypothetical protein RIQ81_2577 [Pseudomonadota bacterium]